MNIFYIDEDEKRCAQYHCDKHVVKMIIEYAQLMSTAHRVIDGEDYIDASSGRKIRRWKLNNERENILYKASHINHPSAVWTRSSVEHYCWLFKMWYYLLKEYEHRYNKTHKTSELVFALSVVPTNIDYIQFEEPPLAMPEECKIHGDAINSYRQYYILKKNGFAKWTNRAVPDWYQNGVIDLVVKNHNVHTLYD